MAASTTRNVFHVYFQILEPIEDFPADLLADFICIVRDSVTAYISYFPRGTYSKVLKWANHVYDTRCTTRQINNRAYINLLHLCMFLRYDDVREESSLNIIHKLIAQWTSHQQRNGLQLSAADHKISPAASPHKDQRFWKANVYDAMKSMVYDLVEHVEMVKVTEEDITRYLNIRCLCDEFDEWISEWINTLYSRQSRIADGKPNSPKRYV